MSSSRRHRHVRRREPDGRPPRRQQLEFLLDFGGSVQRRHARECNGFDPRRGVRLDRRRSLHRVAGPRRRQRLHAIQLFFVSRRAGPQHPNTTAVLGDLTFAVTAARQQRQSSASSTLARTAAVSKSRISAVAVGTTRWKPYACASTDFANNGVRHRPCQYRRRAIRLRAVLRLEQGPDRRRRPDAHERPVAEFLRHPRADPGATVVRRQHGCGQPGPRPPVRRGRLDLSPGNLTISVAGTPLLRCTDSDAGHAGRRRDLGRHRAGSEARRVLRPLRFARPLPPAQRDRAAEPLLFG